MSQEREEFLTKAGEKARGLLGWEHIQPSSLDTAPSAWASLCSAPQGIFGAAPMAALESFRKY